MWICVAIWLEAVNARKNPHWPVQWRSMGAKMRQATAHCHWAPGNQQEGDFLLPGIYDKEHGLHKEKVEPKLNTVFGRFNNRRLKICTTYLRLLFITIPVTVISIPVVVFPSVFTLSSFNATSSIYVVFCEVLTRSALFIAPSILPTSAAKRIFRN